MQNLKKLTKINLESFWDFSLGFPDFYPANISNSKTPFYWKFDILNKGLYISNNAVLLFCPHPDQKKKIQSRDWKGGGHGKTVVSVS